MRLYVSCVYFFFFQAEDGIRDVAVTGVQTCALPICDATRRAVAEHIAERLDGVGRRVHEAAGVVESHFEGMRAGDVRSRHRSEERRVGKECRSRWSPYH